MTCAPFPAVIVRANDAKSGLTVSCLQHSEQCTEFHKGRCLPDQAEPTKWVPLGTACAQFAARMNADTFNEHVRPSEAGHCEEMSARRRKRAAGGGGGASPRDTQRHSAL